MKTLKTIAMVGGSWRNGFLSPGFNRAELTDGTFIVLPEGGISGALAQLESRGIDCADYKARLAEAMKPFEPSAKEQSAELYQHNYGGEKPVKLGQWSFSYTFGRWSRLVTFADGWEGYTYPVTN